MKIITYSDLHLEFGSGFKAPSNSDANLMILAGDIITFRDFTPLARFLDGWKKPVLYVAGNHEYYTKKPINAEEQAFQSWLKNHFPNVIMLQNEAITIDGVQFFGGTMWTDFSEANSAAMAIASQQMNDFRLIMSPDGRLLRPEDTIKLHDNFTIALQAWFREKLSGPRIIITHHSPVENPNTQYVDSPLRPAFLSLDMREMIEKHQPSLWVYGHTHECDDQMIGKTRIISNQMGYPNRNNEYECAGFDEAGKLIETHKC